MTTAVLSNGLSFLIPSSDVEFFKALAKKMGWTAINQEKKDALSGTWVDSFAGKWVDSRSAEEIIKDIHDARTYSQGGSL